MIRFLLVALVWLAGLSVCIAAPPPQLEGKSVVIDWSEKRMQRPEGNPEFRPITLSMQLSVYVSTEGRVFNRLLSNSGQNSQAPGPPTTGGPLPDFNGRTMTITQPLRGLARQIVVEFDETFASCTASATVGIESGASSGFLTALGTGVRLEVKSVSAGDAICSVKNGNVFQ
jgi:hypothetical protein